MTSHFVVTLAGYGCAALIAAEFYLLPVVIGWARRVPRLRTVAVIDLALGWTVIGWIAAVMLALRPVPLSAPEIAGTARPLAREPARLPGLAVAVSLRRPRRWCCPSRRPSPAAPGETMPVTAASPARPPLPARERDVSLMDARRAGTMFRGLVAFIVLLLLVAGVPAALEALGDSPVPRRLPSWHKVITALARPDHGTLFLGALRWVTWVAWAVFALCALAELAARLSRRAAWRLPLVSPVQGLASALMGSVFLGLLPGNLLMPSAGAVPRSAVTAAASQLPARTLDRVLACPGQVPRGSAGPASAGVSAASRRRRYVVVEGDSLWEIAARFLGNGERWPEIFAASQGVPQPGGHRLTDPDLIYPGWVLTLPPPPAPIARPRHRPPVRTPPARAGRTPARHPATGPRAGNGRETGRPAAPGRPHTPCPVHHPVAHPRRQRPAGVRLPGGGLVGITLAAAISTALVAWRLHQRCAAIPRWPATTRPVPPDVPVAVRALRRAHLRSLAADTAQAHGEPWADPAGLAPGSDTDDGDGLDEFGAPAAGDALPATAEPRGDGPGPSSGGISQSLPPVPAPTPAAGAGGRAARRSRGELGPGSAPPGRPLPPGTVVFGIRGSEEIPLAEVARPVLGLTGPGACAAARALMIGVLAASSTPAGRRTQVIIPAADARLLTGRRRGAAQFPGVTPGWPDGLIVAASLDAALDLVTAEAARRGHRLMPGSDVVTSARRTGADAGGPGQIVLIATADRLNGPGIRAALEAGAAVGVTGILLGEPAAGISAITSP